ncbi:UNVERIFIED_CONTAM: WD repeat, SAM and U-box domain-containing protein 1 [Siphonaria sp. JEL0065]|nr:WD repeat, SAM and U-box domain-containing protein 1 [Siphonaria sp. JEL0065]
MRNVKIQCELRGYCETRWETNLKLAAKYESNDYKVIRHGRVFRQLVEVVYDSNEPILPNSTGASTAFPFKFRLPKNNMPATFDSPQGSVHYYIKCSLTYQEGMKLLRSHLDFETPVLVLMPDSAKAKLLGSPSHMVHEVAGISTERVGYSLQIPRRILTVGEQLEVNLVIKSTPEATRLRSINASLRVSASFLNKSNVSFPTKFPRPLAETSEIFPLVAINQSNQVVRKLLLDIDPDLALFSFESPLISVKTLFSLDIVIDNSETPNVSFELPIICVPPYSPKQVRPETPIIPAVTSSALPPLQRVDSVGSAANVLASPHVKTKNSTSSLPPYSENFSDQLNELKKLQSEHSKLNALLNEIQAFEVTMQQPIPPSVKESIARDDSATVKSRVFNDDTASILSVRPNEEWSIEDVAGWVGLKGGSEAVVKSFEEQEIDGAALITLSNEDLINELGIKSLGMRRKILAGIEKMKACSS